MIFEAIPLKVGNVTGSLVDVFFPVAVREESWRNASLGTEKEQSTREHGKP